MTAGNWYGVVDRLFSSNALNLEGYQEKVVMILWAIWNAWNKSIFEDKQLLPTKIVADAIAFWEAFQSARHGDRQQQVESTTS